MELFYSEYLPLAAAAVLGWGVTVAAVAELVKQGAKRLGYAIVPEGMTLLTGAACAGLTAWTLLGKGVPLQESVLVACLAVFAPKFAHDIAGKVKK